MGNDYLCVFVVYMLSVMFLCDHVNIDKIRCGLSEWIELSCESQIVGKRPAR